MLGVVISEADPASTAVRERLLELKDWDQLTDPDRSVGTGGGTVHRTDDLELRSFEDLHLHLDGVAEAFTEPSAVVFASRHAGDTGPLLTAHFTGNFGPAEYGGEAGELAEACPGLHDAVLDSLERFAPPGYDVGMECTHHGPSTVGAPSMFVEIGSDEAQWADTAAADAVARSILDCREATPVPERTVVGFGGGHYVPRFDRIRRETSWAIGHIAADWSLEAMPELDPAIIDRCFERSQATLAVVEGARRELRALLDRLGYRVVSETWLRAVDEVPLALVRRAEDRLCPVDDGLRFGEATGGLSVTELDPALLVDANGIDRDRTRSIVADHAVAFETSEGGTRVDGRIALPSSSARAALIDDLVAVLAERFDAVDRGADAIVATERAFDPERARDLGVPEGPAFGRLAAGQPIEIDGTEVDPDEVHVERRVTYSI